MNHSNPLNFSRFGLETEPTEQPVKLVPLHPGYYETYLTTLSDAERLWLSNANFRPEPDASGKHRDVAGILQTYYLGIESADDTIEDPYDYIYALQGEPFASEVRTYYLDPAIPLTQQQQYNLALGWGLGAYRFEIHKSQKSGQGARLHIPDTVDKALLHRELTATFMAQDWINEGANIMNIEALTDIAVKLAKQYDGTSHVVRGEELLKPGENFYPLVYHVGKAAEDPPVVVDLRWGNPEDPAVTLVGKGVIFDEGGLYSKAEYMEDMRNDMAGAAHALAVAYEILDANLPVYLRVLLPIVENRGGPKACKPGDIFPTRMGEEVEIVNPDAEGRLIMADTLYEAAHPRHRGVPVPNIITDFATLSHFGHYELPWFGSYFANQPRLKMQFKTSAAHCQEKFANRPFMPRLMAELEGENTNANFRQCVSNHYEYDDLLAALVLYRQVGNQVPWIHTDLQCWRERNTTRTKYPPEAADGAFAQGVRATYNMIARMYPARTEVSEFRPAFYGNAEAGNGNGHHPERILGK